jgi:hypothetical protein
LAECAHIYILNLSSAALHDVAVVDQPCAWSWLKSFQRDRFQSATLAEPSGILCKTSRNICSRSPRRAHTGTCYSVLGARPKNNHLYLFQSQYPKPKAPSLPNSCEFLAMQHGEAILEDIVAEPPQSSGSSSQSPHTQFHNMQQPAQLTSFETPTARRLFNRSSRPADFTTKSESPLSPNASRHSYYAPAHTPASSHNARGRLRAYTRVYISNLPALSSKNAAPSSSSFRPRICFACCRTLRMVWDGRNSTATHNLTAGFIFITFSFWHPFVWSDHLSKCCRSDFERSKKHGNEGSNEHKSRGLKGRSGTAGVAVIGCAFRVGSCGKTTGFFQTAIRRGLASAGKPAN